MAKTTTNRASINMTQGPALPLLVRFALPLLIGNALQQVYNMVDSMVVGKFVGSTALAAVGVAFPVVFMMSSLFMGLGMGAMVMVSQYYGGGEQENLRRTIDTVYTFLIVGGVPLCLLGIALTNPILNLLDMPPDARDEAFLYLVILMGGLIGSLGYNLNAGLLQGIGDSRTPLIFLTIACLLNIALDLFLVLVIPLGVAGVAIATIAAQAFSWVFGIFYINKKYPELRIRPFSFKFDKGIFKQVVRLGLPAGVQQALFSFAVLMMTRLVNGYGSTYAAGYAAANKLDTFAFLPIQSVTTAATTYTGQNIGAGRLDRVNQGTKASILLCICFAALGLLVIPAGPSLLRMFTDEAAVVEAGMAFIRRLMPFYWMLGFTFTMNSVMRGAGEALVPMVSSVLSMWLARVPAAYLLAHFFGRDNMHFCYPVGWVVGLAITVPYYLSGRWRNKAITRAGSTAEAEAEAAEHLKKELGA
ncbi:MATE family efflux transporter [Ruminococcaceae bacterium OttesenSCG-928-O06]|nr:MATE family efflux transporter [Ruminococcaceae bacterium OttesenSCG-928-O06]